MRRFIYLAMAVSAALGFSGSAAGMTGPSEVVVVNEPLAVDVTNDPLAVEVTNPAPASPPLRWQLVGFTTATYTGAMGGFFGVTQKCQLEFPNSRMCTIIEVEQTTSIPSGLVGQAWVNEGVSQAGGLQGNNCGRWGGLNGLGGVSMDADGTPGGNVQCTVTMPIACCALVP